MKYLIIILSLVLISSCLKDKHSDSEFLNFDCLSENDSFITGYFENDFFCYSQQTGYTTTFLSSTTIVTEENLIEIDPSIQIGDAVHQKKWEASIDINNSVAFEHFITIRTKNVLNLDSMKVLIKEDLIIGENLLDRDYDIVFSYIDDSNIVSGSGRSIKEFFSKKEEGSYLVLNGLDTISKNSNTNLLKANFNFSVDLLDRSDCYFGRLKDCNFEITFIL